MATPTDVLDAIVEAVKQSTAFDGGSYFTQQIDLDGTNSTLEQPVVSVKIVTNPRVTAWDSDLSGYVTNDAGDRVGRIYEATWEMEAEAHILVAAASDLDTRTLGQEFQQALFPYDAKHSPDPLPDPDGGTMTDISHFEVGDGEPDDDLAGPGKRRWRQELAVTFSAETRRTDYPTVTDISTPDAPASHSDSASE